MTIGAIIDPNKSPNLNQILLSGYKILEFNRPKKRNNEEVNIDHILIGSLFIIGHSPIIKNTTKKVNPKLLLLLILILLFSIIINYLS